MKELSRRRVLFVVDHPVPPVVRKVCGSQVPGRNMRKMGIIVNVGRIDHLPAFAGEHGSRGDRSVAQRLQRQFHYIGLSILGYETRRPARHVLRNDGRLIATARVKPVEFFAIVAELDGSRVHGICHVDLRERLPFAVRPPLQIHPAPLVGHAESELDLELRISEKANEAIVLLQQRTLAGRNIDTEDFEEALVALIVRDQ